jgi:hypothetical protein
MEYFDFSFFVSFRVFGGLFRPELTLGPQGRQKLRTVTSTIGTALCPQGLEGFSPTVCMCLATCPDPPSSSSSSFVSVGDRGGLPGWKKNTWRKQGAGLSLVPPEIRTRTKDDRRHDAKQIQIAGLLSYLPPGRVLGGALGHDPKSLSDSPGRRSGLANDLTNN